MFGASYTDNRKKKGSETPFRLSLFSVTELPERGSGAFRMEKVITQST
jgi:hypothetical protein